MTTECKPHPQTDTARAGSVQRLVRRPNPKRLFELAETLGQLRDWAKIEATIESDTARQKIWLSVRDWARGKAMQHKLNLDSGPVALKAQTGSAGPESPNSIVEPNPTPKDKPEK